MSAVRLFQPGPAGLCVRDVIDAYLRHAEAVSLHGPAARAERVYVLGLFSQDCGQLPVSDAKPFVLSDWVESHPTWKSTATKRQKCNAVRACFQWAADTERIPRNPFKAVNYAEAERRPELSDATLEAVCRVAGKEFEAALRFLRLTGCRLSELCEARWADVDLERGVWVIQRHKSRRFTGKPKCVALVGEAVGLLRNILGAVAARETAGSPEVFVKVVPVPAGGTDFIFLNSRGTPWTKGTLGYHFRRVCKRHRIDTGGASLHGIRHRMATAAVAAGAPLKLVAAQLGHATTNITERYYVSLGAEHLDAIRAAAELGRPKK